MDTGLKQRLIGAAVLIALAVIFLPMLVKGPAPDSGVSDVSIKMPDAPDGETETRELPLVMPGDVPKGGAVGMNATPLDKPGAQALPTTTDGAAVDPAAATATTPVDPASALPATAAGGNYAVHFGAYATQKGADTVAALATAAQLPAYTEATTINGKPAFRVRIGPYATRADAETARLKALEVRSDVPVRVVALDAEPAPVAPAAATPVATPVAAAEPPKPATPKPAETKPAEAKPEPKPAAPKPVATKPAEPKPAPAKPADAPKQAAPKPAPPAAAKIGFAVQVGAFSDATEAGAMRERLRAAGFTAFTETVTTDQGKLTRVRVGPVLDRAAADQLKAQIQSKAGVDGIVRPHP
ncbi:SPOR domain-containing protein [Lysobacter brunescens]|uniref:SPOR domain-containing protein n=1 Tax=Lysobacter brunescens TaxID=262323 RepID=A0ABW2YAZ8_9GAMM